MIPATKIIFCGKAYEIGIPTGEQYQQIAIIRDKLYATQIPSDMTDVMCSTIATFSVMAPQIAADLRISDLAVVDWVNLAELSLLYMNIYRPFHEQYVRNEQKNFISENILNLMKGWGYRDIEEVLVNALVSAFDGSKKTA